MKNQSQQPDPKKDRFLRLKFIGYCWSCLPPKEAGVTQRDFIKYAKFYLCQKANRLMKDPIWKTYTDEEIVAEYFAHVMAEDKEFRIAFEGVIKTTESAIEDFFQWTEEMEKKDKIKQIEELPDKISFSPGKE